MKKVTSNRVNVRLLFQYMFPFFVIFLVIMIFSLVAEQLVFRSQTEKSLEDYNLLLESSVYSIERTMAITDSLDYMLNHNTLLQDVMYATDEKKAIQALMELNGAQISFYDNNNILIGYAIYSYNSDIVVTDVRNFVNPEQSYEQFLKYNDLSFEEWLEMILNVSNKGIFIPAGDVKMGNTEESCCILYVKPYFQLKKGKIVWQSVFYLDESEIMGLVTTVLPKEDVIVQISVEDKVLSSFGAWGMDSDKVLVIDSDCVYEEKIIGGTEYYILKAVSKDYGVQLTMGVSKTSLQESVYEKMRYLYVCIGMLFLLVIVVAAFVILKNWQALIGLAEVDGGIENLKSVYDAVVRIKKDNQQMDLQLDDHRRMLCESLFRQLVNGFSVEDWKMEQQLEYVGVQLGGEVVTARGGYLIIDEDMENISSVILSSQEKSVLQVEQVLAKWEPQVKYLFREERNCLTFLYFSEEGDDFTAFREIYQCLKDEYDILVRFYLGKHFTQLHHAKDSFGEARLQMRSDMSQEDRFLIVVNEELTNDIFDYSSHDEEKLLAIIISGDKEAAETMLRKIYKNNFESRHLSMHMRGFLYNRLITTLLCLKKQDDYVMQELLSLKGDCKAEKFFGAYWEQIVKICDQIQEERNLEYKELDLQMIHYIEEHFRESSLSLTEIAIQFGRSESYVSVRVKEILGESFSGYLEKLRVNTAKELLEKDNISIKEIAEMVGYNSASAFGRAYKRVTGITPSEYQTKQKNRMS